MNKLFPVSLEKGKGKEIGYIDQYIYSQDKNCIIYLNGYCYDASTNIFKSASKDLKNLFFNYQDVEDTYNFDRGYRHLGHSSMNTIFKVNKIPNTDLSNIVMYYRNGEFRNGKKKIEDSYDEYLCISKVVYIKLSDIIDDFRALSQRQNKDLQSLLSSAYTSTAILSVIRGNAKVKSIVNNIIKTEANFPYLESWGNDILNNYIGAISFYSCSAYYSDIDNPNNVYAFRVSISMDGLKRYISTRLSQGQLTINGCTTVSEDFKNITNLADYLAHFSDKLIDKTADRFTAVFDPNKEPFTKNEQNYFDYVGYNSSLQLFNTQKKVIGAVSRTLDKERAALVVGEMGTGIVTCN